MKKVRNLVIGGIENKIFNLILFTVILMTAVYLVISLSQGRMLTELAGEAETKQQEAIAETTSGLMDQVVSQSLERSNSTEARIADDMFSDAAKRVTFLANATTSLFAHPERHLPQAYTGPDPADDGTWTAKVIYADGVDETDPAIVSRVSLLANMSDIMISLCPAFGAATVYIALPEGVHLSVSDNSSSWFADGKIISYDPRKRGWYTQAAQAGEVIFTDGEVDATTGAYCIECAAPVYDPEGRLAAVIGADLYLDDMVKVMNSATAQGEYLLLVNQNGRAVLPSQEEVFPMKDADRGADLRESELTVLSQVVSQAIGDERVGIVRGKLADGEYYLTASAIKSTGWALVSAFSQEIAGKPVAVLQERSREIQAEATMVYREKTGDTKRTAIFLVVAAALLMLAGALILGKRIVKPLNTITRRISELSETNMEFKMEDIYRTGDEVEELAQSFANVSHKTLEYLDMVTRVTAEKERLGAELSLATQIQAAMLPHIVPAFPDRTDFDVIGRMDPAKEVGGDFYDYFLVDNDHLCMVMADVSGKGVPAALFMMASKIILQSVAMMGKSPAEILTKANEAICSNNEAQMFVTVWLGILELSTGKLTAANAGHEYPVIKHADGRFELFKDRHGFVIGGMEGARFREYELTLEPGCKLFVYTDGLPEATDNQEEMFGTERMLEALNSRPDCSPQEILQSVGEAVDAFVGSAEQFDDLTMMCLEYKGQNTPVAGEGGRA